MNIKSGVSINTIITSLVSFGELSIENKQLYETNASVNSIPQIGLLFGLGSAYRITRQNLITMNFVVMYNFKKKITVNYRYSSLDSYDSKKGSFYTKGTFIGVAFSYSFNMKKK